MPRPALLLPPLQGFQHTIMDASCAAFPRDHPVVVFRWFSGTNRGTVTAGTCGNTQGDSVLQVGRHQTAAKAAGLLSVPRLWLCCSHVPARP